VIYYPTNSKNIYTAVYFYSFLVLFVQFFFISWIIKGNILDTVVKMLPAFSKLCSHHRQKSWHVVSNGLAVNQTKFYLDTFNLNPTASKILICNNWLIKFDLKDKFSEQNTQNIKILFDWWKSITNCMPLIMSVVDV